MLKKFLFIDLDDTLFQSVEKCSPEASLHPVAYLKDGLACSYTTQHQRSFFELMDREMTMIPTTARNRDAYKRVNLPFKSYSIINYGGVILEPDGSVDQCWLATSHLDMQLALPGLMDVLEVIDNFSSRSGLNARARLIDDCGIPFYVVVKDPQKKSEHLEILERDAVLPWMNTRGQEFFLHRNGNNLAILPKTLNKAHAVDYLRKRLELEHGEIMTFGMGDSKSDARFMNSCDYAIVPRGSQLASMTLAML